MKLGLINSAWAQAGLGTEYGIRMTKELGFDTIDIFADPLDTDAKERKLIKRECERHGLPIVSIAFTVNGSRRILTWLMSSMPRTSCSSSANTSGNAK